MTQTATPRSTAPTDDQLRDWWTRFLQPVTAEPTGEITDIEGEVPREIAGTFYRNGPSQKIAPPEGAGALHFFDGDGLVHALRFEGGRLFRTSRFVRNPSFLCEQAAGRFNQHTVGVLATDPTDELPIRHQHNTNVVFHGGRLMAMVENALPFLLDPKTLDPLGYWDLDHRALGMALTAHPKTDGKTGQMLVHGYQFFPPFLQLYAVEPDGTVTLAEVVDVPYPTLMHDFAITENYVIFQLTPITYHVEMGEQGPLGRPCEWFRWEPDKGLRFGVRKREPGAPLRWFDAPTPRFIFHPGNAYEDGDKIVMDAVAYRHGDRLLRYLEVARSGGRVEGWEGTPVLYELDLASGTCRETDLDDRGAEFPRLDDRRVGYRNRWGYAAVSEGAASWTNLVKYDRQGGKSRIHRFGVGHFPSEPVFVPRSADAEEDDGWVLSVVYDGPNDTSYLAVLNARDFDGEPAALCQLGSRIPLGFHGNWAPFTG